MAGIATAAYPERPIRLVIGQAPGGATDIVLRAFAARWSQALSQTIVVDNRPGAGGTLGAALVSRSPADGHTLLVGTNGPIAIAPHVMRELAYDPLKDFAPVGLFSEVSFILVVHPAVQAATIDELIRLARAHPGKLNFASSGQAGTPHLCGELFKLLTGTDIVHVPYRGGAPAQTDLVAGRVQMYCAGFPGLAPYIRAGRVRALAIAATRRSKVLPGVPTAAEAGLTGFVVSAWNGILAPMHTPQALIERLYAAMTAVSRQPGYEAELEARGVEPRLIGPAQFRDYIRHESDRWGKVVKEARITSE
ncbi:MAG: tripartite tricarboxylate transporter substrate binding protein [Burkholderiales bacterium]|nr:tripartite tricarboxylate transporter substrate binding protein [Burkholderiales bacterium]